MPTVHRPSFEGSGYLYARRFLEGGCYQFAYAAKAINPALQIMGYFEKDNPNPIHVGLFKLGNPQELFDARGVITQTEFKRAVHSSKETWIAEVSKKYLETIEPPDEHWMQNATKLINHYHGTWVIGSEIDSVSIENFLTAFEKLCAEHGYCFREQFPGQPMVIEEWHGDETYEATPDQMKFFVSRTIQR